jgi:hypothetical protein
MSELTWYTAPRDVGLPKVPAWIRSAAIDDAGTVFLPAAVTDRAEASVMLCAAYDGVPLISDRGHAFLPAWWLAREYPDAADTVQYIERRVASLASIRNQETDMPEYTMDLDGAPGNGTYAGGGDRGPYLRWHAQNTLDGAFTAGTWSLRVLDGTTAIQLPEVVVDWPGSRTGWMLSQSGQPPLRRWNTSRAKFEARPDRTNPWHRAVWVEIAYDTDARALWEQGSESAWLSYCAFMALIRDSAVKQLPKLPLLAHTGHQDTPMSRGSATVAQWKLLRYVPRPLCLPEHTEAAPAGNGSGAPRAPSWDAPKSGDLDDEVPF